MDTLNKEKYISLDEAADYFGIKPVTLRSWIRNPKNEVPAHKIDNNNFFDNKREEVVNERKFIMQKKITCVDLFCGCGGMSLGFINAGFDIIAGFENWKPALKVYKDNFSHPVIEQDLSDVDEAVRSISKYKPDMIIGGPPCQDFSTAGYQDESRGRAILSIRYSEIVCSIKPKYFVMENVATIRNTESFRKVIYNFRKTGYGLTQKILDAAFCGVPQTRKRMFVIGILGEQDNFLDDYLERNLFEKPMTIYDYLGDTLGIEYYFRVPTNYNRRGVFSIYEPSMTIRAVDRPIPSGYKGHRNDPVPVSESRCLTPKERSLLQTFPETFVFTGGKSDMNLMIGNAVPVNLARYVGTALYDYITDMEGKG